MLEESDVATSTASAASVAYATEEIGSDEKIGSASHLGSSVSSSSRVARGRPMSRRFAPPSSAERRGGQAGGRWWRLVEIEARGVGFAFAQLVALQAEGGGAATITLHGACLSTKSTVLPKILPRRPRLCFRGARSTTMSA